MNKKLLLIGWDAADWKTIDRLVDRGDMPILKGLIERGIRCNLNTQQPETPSMRRTGIGAAKGPLDLRTPPGGRHRDGRRGQIRVSAFFTAVPRRASAPWAWRPTGAGAKTP